MDVYGNLPDFLLSRKSVSKYAFQYVRIVPTFVLLVDCEALMLQR